MEIHTKWDIPFCVSTCYWLIYGYHISYVRVKKVVPERYIEKVAVQKIRTIQKPTTLIKEVQTYETVQVPTTKAVAVPGYRVDEVQDSKIVEVEESQGE